MSSWRRDSLRDSSSEPLPVVIIGKCHTDALGTPGWLASR